MGVTCSLAHHGLERWLPGGAHAGEAARLFASVTLGVVITAAGASRMGLPEADAIRDRLRRFAAPRSAR
jgi:hypothetical protein